MSIKVGPIQIAERLDHDNRNSLAFFRFQQNKVSYYATSFVFSDEKEGYLAFSLDNVYDRLFKQSDYNNQIMLELMEQKINTLYFISFADEDPESEIIEYVGEIEKGIAINIIKESGKGQPNED
jgi:hypothetical protein